MAQAIQWLHLLQLFHSHLHTQSFKKGRQSHVADQILLSSRHCFSWRWIPTWKHKTKWIDYVPPCCWNNETLRLQAMQICFVYKNQKQNWSLPASQGRREGKMNREQNMLHAKLHIQTKLTVTTLNTWSLGTPHHSCSPRKGVHGQSATALLCPSVGSPTTWDDHCHSSDKLDASDLVKVGGVPAGRILFESDYHLGGDVPLSLSTWTIN